MNRISIFLSVILALIFGLSIHNSIKSFNDVQQVSLIKDNDLMGFDSDLTNNNEFNELEKRISSLIVAEKTTISNLSHWGIGLNLLITLVTGFSALITTISTIKNNSVSKSIAILVALITFLSSLLSYSMGQVNTLKGEAEYKRTRIIQIREELESLKPNEVHGQLSIFNRKLDEVL